MKPIIKRVRDKLRKMKPLEVISFKEWEHVENQFIQASQFLNENNSAYAVMMGELKEAEKIVLENRVHEVREVRVVSNIMQKIFVTPKEEQMNELVGQIKFIRGYVAELQSWIDRKIQLENMEANGKIIIRRSPEEEIHG